MDCESSFDVLPLKEDRRKVAVTLPKNYLKYGYVQKFMSGSLDSVPESQDDLKANHTKYSLNKKGRWNLVDAFRSNVESFNNNDDNVAVSMIEKHFLEDSDMTPRHRANTLAYHFIDEDGGGAHRYASSTYANEKSLTSKTKPQKKKGKGRRRSSSANDIETIDEEPIEQVNTLRYEIQTRAPSVSLYEKAKKSGKYHDIFMRPSEARHLYEDWEMEYDNQMNEDYWQDVLNAIDDDKFEPNEYKVQKSKVSLADFVNDTSKEELLERKLKKKQVYNNHRNVQDGKARILLFEEIDDDVVVVSNDNVVPPVVRPTAERIADFEMAHVEISCTNEDLDVEKLQYLFGSCYYECACLPRRFCVDFTERLGEFFNKFNSTSTKYEVSGLCVFEVVPPKVNACCSSSCQTPNNNQVKLRVWLNGSCSKDVKALQLNTLNPYFPHSISEIVESAVKMFTTLPVDSFDEKQVNKASNFGASRQTPATLLNEVNVFDNCLETTEANNIVLEKEELARKLQRQITAVRCFDWNSDVGDNSCGICMEWPIEDNGFCLAQCQHWFCKSCWRTYCTERICNGLIPIKCPEPKCNSIMDYDILTTILPLPQCALFASQYRDRHVLANAHKWTWCPNAICGRILYGEDLKASSVMECICGEMWCTYCKGQVHWPASCEQTKKYLAKIKREGASAYVKQGSIKAVQVKKCPYCFIMMEKGTGCNHMSCRCGNSFCWNCAGKFDNMVTHNCTGADDTFHKVKLVDHVVNREGAIWSEQLYERSVAHRQAVISGKLTEVKNKVLNCLKKQKSEMEDGEETSGGHSLTESDKQFLSSFMKLYNQCHYVLEYGYLWFQTFQVDKKSRKDTRHLFTLFDRFSFVVSRMENSYNSGDLSKVVEATELTETLLQTVIQRILFYKTKN